MSYFKVSIKNLPHQIEDALSGIAFMNGASGISESLSFTQKDLSYDPHLKNPDYLNIDVYFDHEPSLEFLSQVRSLSSKIECQLTQEEEKDWLSEWKKGFDPFEFAKPYWVVPSWCENPTDEKFCIRIDPGMAFGTGTHATTKMCGYFLKKVAQPGQTLLDVGCGSAILSILGSKLGFESITGVEIDPEACRVANENIQLNQCKNVLITNQPIEELQLQADVIVANIIHGVLLQIKEQLFLKLKSRGHIFATGILLEYENEFIDQFIHPLGFLIEKRLEQDGWVGFWLIKP